MQFPRNFPLSYRSFHSPVLTVHCKHTHPRNIILWTLQTAIDKSTLNLKQKEQGGIVALMGFRFYESFNNYLAPTHRPPVYLFVHRPIKNHLLVGSLEQ